MNSIEEPLLEAFPKIGIYEWVANSNELIFKINSGQDKKLLLIQAYLNDYKMYKSPKRSFFVSKPDDDILITIYDVKYVVMQKYQRLRVIPERVNLHLESPEFDVFLNDIIRYFHYFLALKIFEKKFTEGLNLPTNDHLIEKDIMIINMQQCENLLGQSYFNLVISQNLSDFDMPDMNLNILDAKPVDSIQLMIMSFIICEIVNITFSRQHASCIKTEVSRLLSSKVFQKNKKTSLKSQPIFKSSVANAHKIISPMLEQIFPTSASKLKALRKCYFRSKLPKNRNQRFNEKDLQLIDFDKIGIIGQPKHLYTEGLYRIVADEDNENPIIN